MKLDIAKIRRLDSLLQTEIDEGRLPGAVYSVGIGKDLLHENALGYAENLHSNVRPMQMDTIFDLASLTKVVSTLPSILLLVDQGQIRLNDRVALFLPEFSISSKSDVTIRHLLTHSSGLASHRKYYSICSSRDEILRMVINESLDTPPDTKVVYSDLGFILLSEIVEVVSGKRIDQFATEQLFRPLGMNDTQYCPKADSAPGLLRQRMFQG